METHKIIIEILGGMISDIRSSVPIEVIVWDHDNESVGEDSLSYWDADVVSDIDAQIRDFEERAEYE